MNTITENLDLCFVVRIVDIIGDSDITRGRWEDVACVDLVSDVSCESGVAVDYSIREGVCCVSGVAASAPPGAGAGAVGARGA